MKIRPMSITRFNFDNLVVYPYFSYFYEPVHTLMNLRLLLWTYIYICILLWNYSILLWTFTYCTFMNLCGTFSRSTHHFFRNAKVPATRATLMTTRKNRCASPRLRSVAKSLQSFEHACTRDIESLVPPSLPPPHPPRNTWLYDTSIVASRTRTTLGCSVLYYGR